MVRQALCVDVESLGGVAGDMLLAAFIDLGADYAAIERAFSNLEINGLQLRSERVYVDGAEGVHVRSLAPAEGEGHGRRPHDIFDMIEKAECSPRAKGVAREIFNVLIGAEAKVHGATHEDVHLHEVGEVDSIMDVIGIAVAYDSLGAPKMSMGALPSGHGQVNTSHGLLTCPVPAVMEIAKRFSIELEPTDVEGETVTPTGIAALATLCSSRQKGNSPASTGWVGVGVGSKRFPTRPNIIQLHATEKKEL